MTSATDNRTTELLPCPFCGGEASLYAEIPGGYIVQCNECCGQIGIMTKENAIAAWNTRTERTCHNTNHHGYGMRFECSECEYSSLVCNCKERIDEVPNYCPNCGAKVIDYD